MFAVLLAISVTILLLDIVFPNKFTVVKFGIYTLCVMGFLLLSLATHGHNYCMELATVYILEFMLSIDHLFLFATILSLVKIDKKHEMRVLVVGVICAIIMRVSFAIFGMKFVNTPYVLEICGVILLYTAYKTLKESGHEEGQGSIMKNIMKFAQKFSSENKVNYRMIKSGIAITLIFITDFIFAIDSLPVAVAIVKDLNIIIFANVLAVIGMLTLFDIMRVVAEKFKFMNYAIAIILVFVSFKLMLHSLVNIPTFISLAVVVLSVSTCVFAENIMKYRRKLLAV